MTKIIRPLRPDFGVMAAMRETRRTSAPMAIGAWNQVRRPANIRRGKRHRRQEFAERRMAIRPQPGLPRQRPEQRHMPALRHRRAAAEAGRVLVQQRGEAAQQHEARLVLRHLLAADPALQRGLVHARPPLSAEVSRPLRKLSNRARLFRIATARVHGNGGAGSMAGNGRAATPHRIVVVGGGAAGLELVTRLGDTLGKSGKAQVTLVEKARTHLWKPLLHAVAAGSLDRAQHELHYLAQAHWHNFTYRFGEMIGLDRAAARSAARRDHDDEGRQITPPNAVPYDTLVISIGSVTNDFGTPGAARFAVPLETPEQAEPLPPPPGQCLPARQRQAEPVRPGQLHVAIIGAGATGTELAAELHRTVARRGRLRPDRIDPERDIRITPDRGRAAHPAGAARADLDRRDRPAAQGGRRGAHRRARQRGAADGVRLADGDFSRPSWWSGPPASRRPRC